MSAKVSLGTNGCVAKTGTATATPLAEALAERYTVIAPDLRGLGDSSKPSTGYDSRTVAEDIYQLVRQLGRERIFLVGHDVGAAVAYTYAAEHRDDVCRLVFMETLVPGLEASTMGTLPNTGQAIWHSTFHQGEEKRPEKAVVESNSRRGGEYKENNSAQHLRC